MIDKPLIGTEPWVEVFNVLKQDIQLLSKYDSTSITPYKIETLTGQPKNTRVYLIGNPSAGLSGKISIDYDRIDPNTLFTKFGSVQRIPALNYFGEPGTTLTISTLLTAINNLLGVNLKLSGMYPDIVESSVVLPSKNQTAILNISVHQGTADIFSLRLITGKSFPLRVVNVGSKLSQKLLSRNITPYINGTALNWKLFPKNIGTVAISPDLLLQNIDFTDLFGTTGKLRTALVLAGGSHPYYGYKRCKFTSDVLASINTRLISYGLAPLDDSVHVYISANATIPAPDATSTILSLSSPASSPATLSTTGGYTTWDVTRIAAPAQMNNNFQYVLKVFPNGWVENVPTAVYPTPDLAVAFTSRDATQRPMLFHFNAIT